MYNEEGCLSGIGRFCSFTYQLMGHTYNKCQIVGFTTCNPI